MAPKIHPAQKRSGNRQRKRRPDVQAAQPDAMAKNYIPALADILQATRLLNPGETEVLKFDLKTPGDYPYFCTFPGHCHVMRGVLKVQP